MSRADGGGRGIVRVDDIIANGRRGIELRIADDAEQDETVVRVVAGRVAVITALGWWRCRFTCTQSELADLVRLCGLWSDVRDKLVELHEPSIPTQVHRHNRPRVVPFDVRAASSRILMRGLHHVELLRGTGCWEHLNRIALVGRYRDRWHALATNQHLVITTKRSESFARVLDALYGFTNLREEIVDIERTLVLSRAAVAVLMAALARR